MVWYGNPQTPIIFPQIAITNTSLPNATVGVAYSNHINIINNHGAINFQVSGSTGGWLTINSSGFLLGTPITADTETITVTATDSLGQIATAVFPLTVQAGGALQIITSSLSNATVGTAYSSTLQATGGTPPYTWNKVSAVPNTLLAWTVTPGGVAQATPQAAETTSLVVQVNDSAGGTAQATLPVQSVATGALSIVTASLPNATNGGAYAVQLIAQGGVPPYSWTKSSTTGSAVITLDPNGNLHCVPSATGANTFTVTCTDSSNAAVTSPTLTLTVDSALRFAHVDFIDNVLRLPEGFAGTKYGSFSPNIQAQGGTAPYTFTLLSGALPSGLALASSGAISGTIGVNAGAASGVLQVTDNASNTATIPFLLNVLSKDNVTRPVYNTGTGFFVAGGYLRDPNGNRFTMRGWNRDHYDQVPTGWQLTNVSASKDGTGQTNGTVALSVYTNDINNNNLAFKVLPLYPIFDNPATGASTSGDTSTVNLAACVGYWNTNRAAYLSAVGNNWIPGVANEWSGGGSTTAAAPAWFNAHVAVMATITSVSGTVITVNTVSATNPYASCPFAYVSGVSGVTNQMVNIASTGGISGAWTVTATATVGTSSGAGGTLGGGSVGAMRAGGWTTPIKIDAGNFGQSPADILTYAPQIQASDPQQNVIFDLHMYSFYTLANNQVTSAVPSGGNTLVTLNSTASIHPFENPIALFHPALTLTLQGASGGTWASTNNQQYSIISYSTSAPWTVTIALNSSGLGTYTANSARAYDSYNPVILMQSLAALRAQNVCVYIGEFGVYQDADQTCFTQVDVVQACEANNLGWCQWAWDDIGTGSGGASSEWALVPNPFTYTNFSTFTASGQSLGMHPRCSCSALATAAPVFLP